MKLRSVFEFESYKKIMANRLAGEGSRGQVSRAAEALGCQPSFLSRVMSSEIQLTPDHAFLLCEFWALTPNEAQYFQVLVDMDRASNPKYKAALKAKASALRQHHESIQNRAQKPEFSVSHQQASYFSSWCWSAIHFLVCIPEFQSVRALSQRLGVPEPMVLHCLEQLAASGLVRKNKNQWEYASGQFHIPKDSPFVVLHHQNWRARALLDAQNPLNQSIHFTNVMTLSHDDLNRLKEVLLGFISESHRIAKPSAPEECAVLTCDLFPI